MTPSVRGRDTSKLCKEKAVVQAVGGMLKAVADFTSDTEPLLAANIHARQYIIPGHQSTGKGATHNPPSKAPTQLGVSPAMEITPVVAALSPAYAKKARA